MYLQELSDSLRFREVEELEVYDLDRLVQYRYASFFTITNFRGGPLQTNAPRAGNLSSNSNDAEPTVLDDAATDNKDEDEEVFSMAPGFMVKVAHASIAEFFQGSDQEPGSTIRVNVAKAKIKITETCLRTYVDPKIFSVCDTPYGFVRYATHIFEHLPTLDLTVLDKEEKKRIADLLVPFFKDKDIIARWVKSGRHSITIDLLISNDFTSAVCRWYQDPDVRASYMNDDATLEWLDLVTSEPLQELIKPVALECARRWLQDSITDWYCEVQFIHAYLFKVCFVFQIALL
jgi:hypothetical protein